MVYCTNCGTTNADDATISVKCGTLLHGATGGGRTSLGRSRYERGHGFRGRDRPLIGIIIIGIVIIFIGLSFLLSEYGITVPWWEILIILLGVYLVAQALRVWNRRK